MNLDTPENCRRFISELRSELETDRAIELEEWGDVDDEIVALYIADACSPEERLQVESAMLKHSEFRGLVRDLRSRPFAIRIPESRRRRHIRPSLVAASISLAAALIITGIAIVIWPSLRGRTDVTVLMAKLEPQPAWRLRINNDSDDPAAIYQVESGSEFNVLIRSPRGGIATLAVLTRTGGEVYPLPGQEAIKVVADSPHSYGPLEAPSSSFSIMLLVAQSDVTVPVRSAINMGDGDQFRPPRFPPSRGVVQADFTQLIQSIQDIKLWPSGLDWVAGDWITIEPIP